VQLTKFSDYALRTLMVLAASPSEPSSIDALAAALDVSAHHLGKVVLFLAGAGYVHTRRGRGGGIELAMAADAIRVGAVLRETERGAPLVPCFDPATNTCNLAPTCRLSGALARAEGAFFAALDDVTLETLVAPRSAARATLVALRQAAR
jgi:Rrf2 family transcriptional regulator, nitric oxide-sensitive transcriptional repressor